MKLKTDRTEEIIKEQLTSRHKDNGALQHPLSTVDQILHLQRITGNQVVQQIIKSGAVRPKLKIGSPNDKYEQEADEVAERVMREPEQFAKQQPINFNGKPFQTKETYGKTLYINHDSESHANTISGSDGKPLSESTRSFFEPRFGLDLSKVRVHTGIKAAKTAKILNAQAFTVGKDIAFGEGSYLPETNYGKHLLAHELSHVVQQSQYRTNVNSGMLFRKNQGKATGIAIRKTDLEQMAKDLYVNVRDSKSVSMIEAKVESDGPSFLEHLGADAVVISLSGAGGYIWGGGAGVEALYSPNFGWRYFWHWDIGAVYPAGAGAALEVGFLWDLKNPKDYEGQFIELAFTFGPGKIPGPKGIPLPGMGSISGSITAEDLVFYPVTEGEMKQPRGFKVGGGYGIGSKWQIAILREMYYQFHETEPLERETEEEPSKKATTPERAESEVISEAQKEFIQNLKEREIIYDFEDNFLPKIYKRKRSKFMSWILRDLKAGKRKVKIVRPEGYIITPEGWVEYNWWECFLNSEEDAVFNVRGYELNQKKENVTLSEAKVETWNFIGVKPPCPYFDSLYDRSLRRFLRNKSSQVK